MSLDDDFKLFEFKDFLAGWLGGAAGIVVGQPFDTVKVRMANFKSSNNPSMMKTFFNIQRKEGFLSLFKGTLAPSMGYGVSNSIAFGFFEGTNRFFCRRLGLKSKDELPIYYLFLSGAVGGYFSDIATSPAELIKTQIQQQKKKVTNIQTIKHIYRRAGIRGYFKGFGACLIRDGPAWGAYFGFYEYFRRRWGDSNTAIINAGGIGGVASWAINYPFDLVKTRLQALPYKPDPGWNRYKGIWDCLSKTYRADGLRGFYRGFLPCAIRGYPVNAVTFWVYEQCMRRFRKLEDQVKDYYSPN